MNSGDSYMSRFTIPGYTGFGGGTAYTPATVSMDVKYDNDDDWRNVYDREVAHKKNIRISVRPRYCDTMQYRLRGTGKVRLYSIVKHTETAEEG